jgi:hypothetical protein
MIGDWSDSKSGFLKAAAPCRSKGTKTNVPNLLGPYKALL